jgi:hypothetical protein
MREEHAVCVKFTRTLVPARHDSADFEGISFRYKICYSHRLGNWGIGLLLRIESAGSATGLSRHVCLARLCHVGDFGVITPCSLHSI